MFCDTWDLTLALSWASAFLAQTVYRFVNTLGVTLALLPPNNTGYPIMAPIGSSESHFHSELDQAYSVQSSVVENNRNLAGQRY